MTISPHYLLEAVIHMDNQLEDNVLDVSAVILEKACIAQWRGDNRILYRLSAGWLLRLMTFN